MDFNELNAFPPMMDVEEVAAFLRTGKQTVYSMAKTEGFPAVVVGGKIRIIRDALKAWLAEQVNRKANK